MKNFRLTFLKRLLPLLGMVFLLTGMTYAQNTPVTGTVIEETGMPIPGVSVLLKGTRTGTTTDFDGKYSINVPQDAVLIFSYMGFTEQAVSVAGKTAVNITMLPDNQALDEVIVMAYGTTNKEALTGSASVIKAADLEKINNSSITKSLEGLSAGVQVINTDGRPGSESSILVRGITSFNASNAPLYIVDGAAYEGALNQISTSDIESMTVLKDAAANALYGSRASGGVIVITTKQGKSKEGRVNFKAKWGYTDFAVDMPKQKDPGTTFEYSWLGYYQGALQNGETDALAREYASNNVVAHFFPQFNEALRTATGRIYYNSYDTDTPVGTDGKIKSDASYLWPEENFDWYNSLFDTGYNEEYSVDFSGRAGDKLQYYFSINHLNDGGIYTTQEFERTTARLNLTAQVKDWIKLGTNFSYSHSFQNDVNAYTRFYRTMPSVYAVNEWDYANQDYFYDSYGNKIPDDAWDPDVNQTRLAWSHWVQQQQGEYMNDYGWSFTGLFNDSFNTSNYIELDLMEGLKFKSSVSLNLNLSSRTWFTSITDNPSGPGNATESESKNYSLTYNNLLTYNKSYGSNNINLLLGQEIFSQQWNYLSASAQGFPIDGLYELNAATEPTAAAYYLDEYKLQSYFANAEYNYDNKYYLGASIRTDGSSRFHPDTRWGTFWSGSMSWRISKEDFIDNVNWLDELKAKASIGSVGNDKVGLYAYEGLFSSRPDLTNTGYLMSTLATPELKWEQNIQTNFGVEFGLFKRLNGSVEYFIKDSKDLLFEVPLSPSSGFTGYNQNIGNLRNSGIEVNLGYAIMNKGNLRWDISGNLTSIKNEITKLPENWNEVQGNYYRGVGNSLYDWYMPEWAGLNEVGANTWYVYEFERAADGEFVRNSKGEKNVLSRTITTEYSDVNNTDQRRLAGSSLPKVYGSVTNSITWKGIDFSAMIFYSLGQDVYDVDFMESTRWRPFFAVTENWDKYGWDFNGNDPNSLMPRVSEVDYANGNTGNYSTQYLFKNNYLRLRNLTIGYTFPKALTRKIQIENFRIYVSGDNLFTIGDATERGTDPSVGLSGRIQNGNESNQSFSTRKFMNFGLNVTF